MNILVVTPYLPHPLAGHGGSEYVYGLVKHLSNKNRVTVISFLDEHEETLAGDLNSLPVRFQFIRRKKGKQPSFTGNILLLLLRGYQFLMSILLWSPYLILKYRDSEMAQVIEKATTNEQFDVIQFEFTQMAQYVRFVKKGRTILRQHDVNIKPWKRQYENARNVFKKFFYFIEYQRWLQYEPAMTRTFDAILTFTETDCAYLRSVSNSSNVFCHPRGIETPENITPYKEREPFSLLFVGVYNHVANRDSVIWLCEEIFPEVLKRCPQAVLYVVGKYPPEEVQTIAAQNSAVRVMGFVPAIEEYYNKVQVFISPVRLGGGIKTKVLHAQSHGMATVTNTVGCEGIKSVSPSTAIVSDSVEGLAEGVVRLFNNPAEAEKMADAGRTLVNQHYAWSSVINELESFYHLKHYGTTTISKN